MFLSMSSSFWNILLGGGLTLLGGIGARKYQHWKERKQLESSLAADIHTFDPYLERIYAVTYCLLYPDSELPPEVPEKMRDRYEGYNNDQLRNSLDEVELQSISDTVYAANMDKIGRLKGETPRKIIEFYNNHRDLKEELENANFIGIATQNATEVKKDQLAVEDRGSTISIHRSVHSQLKNRNELLEQLGDGNGEFDRERAEKE